MSDLFIGILFTFWLLIPIYFLTEPAHYKQCTSPLAEPPLGLQGFPQHPQSPSGLFQGSSLMRLSVPSLSSSLSPWASLNSIPWSFPGLLVVPGCLCIPSSSLRSPLKRPSLLWRLQCTVGSTSLLSGLWVAQALWLRGMIRVKSLALSALSPWHPVGLTTHHCLDGKDQVW